MKNRGRIFLVLAILAFSAGMPAFVASCGSEPHRPSCCCSGDGESKPMRDGCPCSMSPTPSAPNVPGESGAAPDARTLVPVADVEAGPAAALDEAPPDRDAGLRPPGARDSVPLYLSDRALRR